METPGLRMWAGLFASLLLSVTLASAKCNPSVESCEIMQLQQAGLPGGPAFGLEGAIMAGVLTFEPGSFANLFDYPNYYVPRDFSNSFPNHPDSVAVSDAAREFGCADDIISFSLDFRSTGLVTLTTEIKMDAVALYSAIMKITSSAFTEPYFGGVIAVTDDSTAPIQASISDKTLVLRAPETHYSTPGVYVATFQLVPCAPGAPCCDNQGQLKTQGTQCRSSTGACAEAAVCTGTASSCPNNPLKPAGTVCGSSRACTNTPYCNGTSAACPLGSNRPDKTACLQDDPFCVFPYASNVRMSLSTCNGQCRKGKCQQNLNKQGCCYTSVKVARTSTKTVYCWE